MTRRVQQMNSAQSMLFDCYFAECFIVQMKNPVRHVQLKNSTPGKLYTFIFQQDAQGENDFKWPNPCRNGMPIDLSPGATSVQNFIGNTGNFLQAIEPGGWNP